MSASGLSSPFAPAYTVPDGSESYIAVSPGLSVASSGCSFPRDDVYGLDLSTSAPGVTRVSPDGDVSHFATVSGASTLGGITFDTVGRFGHRLLVIGGAPGGLTGVFAIDCRGAVSSIGAVATALEGGIAVAPPTFGAYAGQLIAPNETNGNVYAVSASGGLSTVVASGVPAGGDIGVESVGFVPGVGAIAAYMADRVTTANPHPGTDSLLRLSGASLSSAGVAPGDALVGTEGGATVVDVRCDATCSATVVALGPSVAHGEGKIVLVATATPRAAPGAASRGVTGALWAVIAVGAALIVTTSGLLLVVRRRTSKG